MPRITLASIFVNDQQRAEHFYTRVLGFAVRADEPIGAHRWLTVVSRDDPEGTELLLEVPNDLAQSYQRSLYRQRIPATSFAVDDLDYEFDRLLDLGATVLGEVTDTEVSRVLLVDDTCGNWIQLTQPLPKD